MNKEKPTVHTLQACRREFGNSSTGAGATKEPKPLALLTSFLPGCSHDLPLTPPHLGKAVPTSHKNTPGKSQPALHYLKPSDPAQPRVFRADRAAENTPDTGTSKGCWKARNSLFPCSLALGPSRKHNQKIFHCERLQGAAPQVLSLLKRAQDAVQFCHTRGFLTPPAQVKWSPVTVTDPITTYTLVSGKGGWEQRKKAFLSALQLLLKASSFVSKVYPATEKLNEKHLVLDLCIRTWLLSSTVQQIVRKGKKSLTW